MIGYHLVYEKENFSQRLLDTIERCVGLEPDLKRIKNFLEVIGELYDIKNKCSVVIKETTSNPLNEGIYLGITNEIIFYNKPSLITVLHEVRHYIQHNTDLSKVKLSYDDKELEARAWSSSLFYAVYPKEYIELCNKGFIKYK